MYDATCEVRVKTEVLQVSNRGQCFMSATELHRPCGPNEDAGRSEGPSFHTFTRLVVHSCLTNQHTRRELCPGMTSLFLILDAEINKVEQYLRDLV